MSKEPDFSRFFAVYWPYAHELAGDNALAPLTVLELGRTPQLRLERHGAREGDVIVPITTHAGAVFVLGAMQVGGRAQGKVLVSLGPDRVGGRELVAVRLDRRLTVLELRRWLVHGSRGARQPVITSEGKVWRLGALEGIRRLHEKTARLVWEVLHRPPLEVRRGPTLEQLEKQVRGQPWARARAAVLADAMAEAGDPRGRIMSLELSIAAESDPKRAAALDGELEALLGEHPYLLRRAGGFPWRQRWSSRRQLEFTVSGTLKRTTRLGPLIESLFDRCFVWVRPAERWRAMALRDAIGGRALPQHGSVVLDEREIDLARWFAAAQTFTFAGSVSTTPLRWPGSSHRLPLQSATTHFGELVARFPSSQLTLQLKLPDGLYAVNRLVAAWKASFREHGVSEVQVRGVPGG